MILRYLGHSSFLFVSDGGVRIVTDPFGDVGLSFPRVRADGVTVSHAHYDHCNTSAVEGAFKIFDRAGEFSLGDVKLCAIERAHDECGGKKRGKTLVFFLESGGIRLCHLGDLGENFSEELCSRLRPVDVLLIPVGGNYTIDAAEAKKYVDAVGARIVIPMHYFVKGLKVDIAPPDDFLRSFENVEKRKGEIDLAAELFEQKCAEKDLLRADRKGLKILYLERSH